MIYRSPLDSNMPAHLNHLTLKVICLAFAPLLAWSGCTKTEELSGNLDCDFGGRFCPIKPPPAQTQFFLKDRSASAPDTLAAYKPTNVFRIAESEHFWFYRADNDAEKISAADASAVLFELEMAYEGLKEIYGGGRSPRLLENDVIILFAADIPDDYSPENPGYVAGFVNPPDLFTDEFTQNVFYNLANDPDFFIDETSLSLQTIATLAGRSNEIPIVYLDLDPLYTGAAFDGDAVMGTDMFIETALHELSHLFTLHRRVHQDLRDNHHDWIAEGIALQAPALLAERYENTKLQLQAFGGRVQGYLADGAGLLGLDYTGSAEAGYVQTGLFFNYLRHRAGPLRAAETIERIVKEEKPGPSGLDKAIAAKITGQDFSSIFSDWVIANYHSTVAGNFVYLNSDGQEEDGQKFTYNKAGINKAGQKQPAFPKNALPVNPSGTATSCLRPTQYLYLEYTVLEGAESYHPITRGMHPDLSVVSAWPTPLTEGQMSVNIGGPETSFKINALAVGTKVHFMVFNPHLPPVGASGKGPCLSVGLLLQDSRHLADWLGGFNEGWMTGLGAPSGAQPYADQLFIRPKAMAAAIELPPAPDKKYMYIADGNKHAIIRRDLETGSFQGVMGSGYRGTCSVAGSESESACATAGGTWDDCGDLASDRSFAGWLDDPSQTLSTNYCSHSFGAIEGIAVAQSNAGQVLAGDIFVADRSNHRVVWRGPDGSFIGWLGSLNSDRWQCGSFNPHSRCLASGGGNEEPPDPSLLSPTVLGRQVQTGILSPYDIAIGSGSGSDVLYIASFGGNRILRRNLSTGEFLGFIGNGVEGWETGITDQVPISGQAPGYLKEPTGLALDEDYLYVVDKSNHRVSRWTLDGLQQTKSGNTKKIWIGNNRQGWHKNTNTKLGHNDSSFYFPLDVSVDDTYLYISDTFNQRIARWKKNGNPAGWIGGGVYTWQTGSGPIQVQTGNEAAPPFILQNPLYSAYLPKSVSGFKHNYLFLTTIFNARLTRFNLDCMDDPFSQQPCSEEN